MKKTMLTLAVGLALTTTGLPAQDISSKVQPLPDAPASAEAGPSGEAKDEQAELAKKLQNPVASLISVPIQNNWDFGLGQANATKFTANVQPVVPFSISEDWSLIIRTIVPIIYQEALDDRTNAPAGLDESHGGLGDITQSFFLSPKEPLAGWVLGAGPVGYYPTADDRFLGAGKWGAGPTIVALQQNHGFTYGVLANQIWSFAGESDREDINSTFVQPFLSFTTKTFTTLGVNTESTYDWEADQATVPMNFTIQQLVKIGKQPVAFQFGYRYYVNKPDGGPDWGLRFTVTFLFPKK